MKYCPECQTDKPNEEFYGSKQTKDGLFGYCKSCVIARRHIYRANNKLKIKKYQETNSRRRANQCKKWRANNKEKRLIYKRLYEADKKKTDIGYRLLCNIRNRIRNAITTNSKTSPTRELLGCSIDELRAHLERQFTSGMTWANYGVKGWHIDHRKPCASFDLTIPEQQKECFNFSNLQPLWHTDNLKKGAKII